MKKFSRITAVILAVVMLFGVMMIAPFSAGAATSAWKAAYIDFVKNHTFTENLGWYYLKDVDNNGIPELFYCSGPALGEGMVCSYAGNKLSYVNIGGHAAVYVQNNMFYLKAGF